MSTLQKTLTILLVIAILGAIGSLSYALVMPKEGERFTEFYILGPEGTVKNYPYEVTAGAPAQVTIGIVNHEYRSMKYRVEIQVDNGLIGQQVTEALDHNQKWETTASFTINTAGKNQRIKFYLYKDGELSSLFKEPLWLVVNVTPPK